MSAGKILVVCGPTATGKTRLGIELAREYGGEIVSADSMQIYRRMDIGTAKPTPEDRKRVPQHLIDRCEPDEPYSVSAYAEEAEKTILSLHSAGKEFLFTGGPK